MPTCPPPRLPPWFGAVGARARAWVACALAGLLLGCGGADRPAEPPALAKAVQAAPAAQAVARSLAPPGADTRKKALAAGSAVAVEDLLDWAERAWPTLFPVGPVTQSWETGSQSYRLRQYGNGNTVGVAADGTVWGLGPFTNQVLTNYGAKDSYLCLVSPGLCDPQPKCRMEIRTGFAGDLNATYEPASGDGSGDGGAAGDGDGGSAGAGGSEGKVLGARFRAYRLADGALLAQGLTDTTRGLATIHWCPGDLPVLLELQGAPGAQYYDEALDKLVDFPLTQKLRALVDRFDENIGVSALTEAAYLYAMNQLQGDAKAISAGLKPVVTDGVPVGLTAAQVRQANQRVLDEVNNRLSETLQQSSMKALATPVDSSSDRNALPRNRYGRLAALTGGFTRLARSYNRDTATPALTFTRQFALDLSDGRLDETTLAGQPVAGLAQRTYQASQASQDFTLGQGAMAQRFGQDTTLLDGEPYVDFQFLWLAYSPDCHQGWGETAIGDYFLSKIGTVTVRVSNAPPGGCIWDSGFTRSYELNFLRDIRKLVPGASGRMFAITNSGDVLGWGWNSCNRVGNGVISDTISARPVKVAGISRVVDMVLTGGVNIALTTDGEVYTWGADYNLAAGQGPAEGRPTCLDRWWGPTNEHYTVPIVSQPTKVPGLSNIVAIAANPGWSSVAAVDADGRRWEWGQVSDGKGSSTVLGTPRLVPSTVPVLKISASPSMFFGVARGGRVLTWWLAPEEIFEGQKASELSQPRLLDGVTDVVDIVSDTVGGTMALRSDGSVMLWGHWRRQDGDVTLTPKPGINFPVYDPLSPNFSSPLPRMVRLTVLGGFVAAMGANGLSYRFAPGPTPGEFRWDVNSLYTDVPSPY